MTPPTGRASAVSSPLGPWTDLEREIEVLIRSVDAGPTYVAVRWLDEEATASYTAADPEDLAPLLHELHSGLLRPLNGEERVEQVVERALTRGVFVDPERLERLVRKMADLILPQSFWARLAQEHRHRTVRIRIMPSRRLSAVPWELLTAPSGARLVDLAVLVYEIPATVHRDRPRPPPKFEITDPALFTVDPVVPGGRPVVGWTGVGGQKIAAALGIEPVPVELSRKALSDKLNGHPRRWLYFGHVSNAHDQPGAAALHLTDPARMYGRAEPVGRHRPFTALDLFLGTSHVIEPQDGVSYPGPPGVGGCDLWPMPNRVAFIACESGAEHASSEPFGLIVSAMLAGAEFVTSTRWIMPTDFAFAAILDDPLVTPTTDLVLAVNAAHDDPDPVLALRAWQLKRLQSWDRTGDVVDSPIVFTGITTHHAPYRDPVTGIPVGARSDAPLTAGPADLQPNG